MKASFNTFQKSGWKNCCSREKRYRRQTAELAFHSLPNRFLSRLPVKTAVFDSKNCFSSSIWFRFWFVRARKSLGPRWFCCQVLNLEVDLSWFEQPLRRSRLDCRLQETNSQQISGWKYCTWIIHSQLLAAQRCVLVANIGIVLSWMSTESLKFHLLRKSRVKVTGSVCRAYVPQALSPRASFCFPKK